MNQYLTNYSLANQYQVQWTQYIVPIMVGIMLVVVIGGMVRDLFVGKEVKMPILD